MVGQNGRIWIRAPSTEHLRLAIKAFKTIETQAHTSKLTDRISEMLAEEVARIKGSSGSDGDFVPEDSSEVEVDTPDAVESKPEPEPETEPKEVTEAEEEKPAEVEAEVEVKKDEKETEEVSEE